MLLFHIMLPLLLILLPAPHQQDPPPATGEAAAISPDDTDGDGVANAVDLCEGFITGASEPDANGCPTEFDPYAELEYDHKPHELWYGRFWTGRCEGVPGFCIGGDPAWFDVTEELVALVPEAQQGVLRNRLWAAGRAIGYEWASDPNLNDKQIFTQQLRVWGRQLERADGETVFDTLTEIENDVCGLLGADAFEGGFSPAPNCQPETAE